VNKAPARAANPMRLLPAGVMLARVAEVVQKGEVPGMRSASALFMPDGHHVSPTGNYLLAMGVYAALYGRKPEIANVSPASRQGVGYTGLPGAETLAALRDLVWDAVQTFERTGHNNRRSMSECRQRLVQRCGAVPKFVCENDIKKNFAD
jgi:hypothetical protein